MSESVADKQVRIDRDACQGHAVCTIYAPEVFAIDSDERAQLIVDPLPDHLWAGAEEAAANCPMQALLLLG